MSRSTIIAGKSMNTKQLPNVSLIVAKAPCGGIGYKNTIPWNLPEDMRMFKEYTMGKSVVMGRNTFESLPFKNGLPKRMNYVITHTPHRHLDSATVKWVTIEEMVAAMQSFDGDFAIIGGSQIYEELHPYCSTARVTMIDKSAIDDCVKFDSYFKIDRIASSKLLSTHDGFTVREYFL